MIDTPPIRPIFQQSLVIVILLLVAPFIPGSVLSSLPTLVNQPGILTEPGVEADACIYLSVLIFLFQLRSQGRFQDFFDAFLRFPFSDDFFLWLLWHKPFVVMGAPAANPMRLRFRVLH